MVWPRPLTTDGLTSLCGTECKRFGCHGFKGSSGSSITSFCKIQGFPATWAGSLAPYAMEGIGRPRARRATGGAGVSTVGTVRQKTAATGMATPSARRAFAVPGGIARRLSCFSRQRSFADNCAPIGAKLRVSLRARMPQAYETRRALPRAAALLVPPELAVAPDSRSRAESELRYVQTNRLRVVIDIRHSRRLASGGAAPLSPCTKCACCTCTGNFCSRRREGTGLRRAAKRTTAALRDSALPAPAVA